MGFPSPGNVQERLNNTLFGIIIGALLVALVWVSAAAVRGSDATPKGSIASESPDPADSPGTAAPADSASPSPTGSTNDKQALRAAVLSDCRQVYVAQARTLGAAATAMNQWQVHIAAMNQLVLGVISLQQANQFWNQTRHGAHANLRAFRATAARLQQPSTRCPAPPRSSRTSSPDGKLVRCERAVAARDRVLRSARAALGTWGMHVMHMEMLRNGQMSPQRAQSLWLHSWHEGQREVTEYRAATNDTRGMRC
jgi:hypothetical protein